MPDYRAALATRSSQATGFGLVLLHLLGGWREWSVNQHSTPREWTDPLGRCAEIDHRAGFRSRLQIRRLFHTGLISRHLPN